jgi:ferrochelatase
MRISVAQAQALEERLGVPVRVAARHFHPYIRDVVTELACSGTTTLVSLPLAPQSVDVYHAEVRRAARGFPDLVVRYAPSWGLEPKLIDALRETVDEALDRFADATDVPVVLTAHSLPRHVILAGDPYEEQFRAMAAGVAAAIEAKGHPVRVAFQSQGMDGGDWLGPDLLTVFAELSAAGRTSAVVAAIGFVADHVETLYDLDIEAPQIAARAGLARIERAASMNTRRAFIDALEAIARPLLETPGSA